MKIFGSELEGVLLLQKSVFPDDRGWFQEMWSKGADSEPQGVNFVQDNLAYSKKGVLRGLHYQDPHPQGKLIMVALGEVFDVAVDIRPESKTYGKWMGTFLGSGTGVQIYVPPGFAHGYLVVSSEAIVLYKCTDHYYPEASKYIRWDDPTIGIDWPEAPKVLSVQDENAPTFL